ncbi:pentapeptide repeat-containing protein [Streptomyces sp. NPDC050287]|uniref:pentapeptide repeat-containing protein n=1 Tax=Streptomyces sp. NPDC050287 TaxID=3365608 RepID=UPI003797C832
MPGADLADANLSHADLAGANLSHADLTEVVWSERTRWPDVLGESMRRRCVPIGGGKWRIQGAGNSGADLV